MSFSQETRQIIRERGKYHCEYCKRSEDIMGSEFEVDHIHPKSRDGTDDAVNLCYACTQCNRHKASRTQCPDPETEEVVPLFNPRTNKWSQHFHWSEDYTQIVARTSTRRATVTCLKLNNALLQKARQLWVKAGWTPPQD